MNDPSRFHFLYSIACSFTQCLFPHWLLCVFLVAVIYTSTVSNKGTRAAGNQEFLNNIYTDRRTFRNIYDEKLECNIRLATELGARVNETIREWQAPKNK
jgi:hypothetical protein